jgi:YVTN family beta-propeller protein
MSTIAQRFAENTEALNTLTTAVQSAIDASASIGGRPVDLTGLSDGVLLRYQSAGNKWVVITPDSLKTALDLPPNLSFDLTGVEDGDTLAWNAALNRFEPVTPEGGLTPSGASNKSTLFVPRSRTVSLGQSVTEVAPPSGQTGGAPLIPKFSGSNIQVDPVSGETVVVSSSSNWDWGSGRYAAWMAFNRDDPPAISSTHDGWAGAPSMETYSLTVQFASAKSVGSYSLTSRIVAPMQMPRGWQFQGSTNGTTWVTLHTVTSEPLFASQQTRVYVPTTVAPYAWFRFLFTSFGISLEGQDVVVIGEAQFFTPTSSGGGLVTRFTPGEIRSIPTQRLYSICPAEPGQIFVATGRDSKSDSLTRIDADSLATVGQVPLSQDIYALQYGLLSSDKQFLYDIIQRDGTGALAYNAALGRVYCAIGSTILVTDLINNTDSVIAVEENTANLVQGIALHNGRIYATINNVVKVYNSASNAFVADVPVGQDARLMGIDTGRSLLFVANRGSNTVTVVSTDTNAVITTINVGQAPTDVTASSALGKAIVCNSEGGSVTVINTTSNTATGGVTIGVGSEPTEAAIAPSGKAYVACRGYNQLAVIDLATASLIKRIPCDPGPQNVAYEPGSNRVLVGCEVGTVQAFEAE